jgi:hypothetical protein
MLTITLTRHGFDIVSANGDRGSVVWNEVREIVAFKRDLLTVDLICLGFRVDESECCIEVDEECAGYEELATEVERRFEIESDWRSKVAFPAFETNFMTLWGEALLSRNSGQDLPRSLIERVCSLFSSVKPRK